MSTQPKDPNASALARRRCTATTPDQRREATEKARTARLQEHRLERAERRIRQIIDSWPPLTDEQLDVLVRLMRPIEHRGADEPNRPGRVDST